MTRSDKALRRMVSRLPSMSKKDFDAILETLSGSQRYKVIALLEELENDQPEWRIKNNIVPSYTPLIVPDNLSSWLVARVNGNPAAGDVVVERFSMTPQATTLLRSCAAELVPQPPVKSPRPSLIEQLWQRVVGVRIPA